MKYNVYKIEHNNETIYIGRTNNLKRREYQHNYNLRKGKSSQLYDFLRDNNIDNIELILVEKFKKKVESKRYEMFEILKDYYSNKHLLQKIPNISDR